MIIRKCTRAPHIAILMIAALAAALCAGCSDEPTRNEATFRRVRALMDSTPQEAMRILDSIPRAALHPGLDSARFVLLHALAEDKTRTLTTTDSLMQWAAGVFLQHRQSDDLRDALYMRGSILYQTDRPAEAIIPLLKAEELIDSTTGPRTSGLIYQQLSECYNSLLIGHEALDYTRKASRAFRCNHNDLHAAYADMMEGIILNNMARYAEAIPVFESVLDSARKWNDVDLSFECADGMGRAYFGLNDYPKALEYFRYLHENDAFIDSKSVGLWIDMEAKAGNKVLADSMARLLINEGNPWAADALSGHPNGSREIQDAYISQRNETNSLINKAYKASVISTIRQNEELRQGLLQSRIKLQRIYLYAIISIAVVIAAAAYVVIRNIRRQRLAEREDNMRLVSSLNHSITLLHDAKELAENRSVLSKPGVTSILLQHIETLNVVERSWNDNPLSSSADRRLQTFLESMVTRLRDTPDAISEIELMVNLMHHNIIDRLHRELPDLREDNVRLFTLLCFGFSNSWLRRILGLRTLNDLYVRKSRLKSKISSVNPPSLQDFLKFF
ncbi:MAG: tetratricopeptide repeat protein [Muribaculaceae bacterium]|nr:tetratricopeptide repeat protein [Muribaculaceae bacterium]